MQNKFWYVIYTRSRFEKKVKAELDEKGVETFLPLWKEVSFWSDRRKIIESPVFKGYVFVKIDLKKDQLKIFGIKGVVRFISFNGRIAKVNEKDLNWIRLIVNETTEPVSGLNFKAGDRVKIIGGPLRDISGVVHKNSKNAIQIYLESIEQALYVKIKPELLVKL